MPNEEGRGTVARAQFNSIGMDVRYRIYSEYSIGVMLQRNVIPVTAAMSHVYHLVISSSAIDVTNEGR